MSLGDSNVAASVLSQPSQKCCSRCATDIGLHNPSVTSGRSLSQAFEAYLGEHAKAPVVAAVTPARRNYYQSSFTASTTAAHSASSRSTGTRKSMVQ